MCSPIVHDDAHNLGERSHSRGVHTSDSQGSTFYPSRLYRQQEGVQTRADTPEDTRQCKVRICQGRISLHQIQYRLFFNLLKENPQRLQELQKVQCSSASDLPKSLGIINSFRSTTEYMSPYCTNVLVRIDVIFR